MDDTTAERERVLALARERGEFVTLEDGFLYYWPSREHSGGLSACVLRWIVDELDKCNAPWRDILEKACGPDVRVVAWYWTLPDGTWRVEVGRQRPTILPDDDPAHPGWRRIVQGADWPYDIAAVDNEL